MGSKVSLFKLQEKDHVQSEGPSMAVWLPLIVFIMAIYIHTYTHCSKDVFTIQVKD